jgi:hypothetical protein
MKSTVLVALPSTSKDGAIRMPWHSLQECWWHKIAVSRMVLASDPCAAGMVLGEADRASAPKSEAPGTWKA